MTGRPDAADSYIARITDTAVRASAVPTRGGRPVVTASMKSASWRRCRDAEPAVVRPQRVVVGHLVLRGRRLHADLRGVTGVGVEEHQLVVGDDGRALRAEDAQAGVQAGVGGGGAVDHAQRAGGELHDRDGGVLDLDALVGEAARCRRTPRPGCRAW